MGPRDTWDRMADWLRSVPGSLPATPAALLVVSAHWEAPVVSVTSSASPPLLYDYSGFPPSTYELTWPAPGSPDLAARVAQLLGGAGIDTAADARRGFDHGVFIPLKVAYPEPRIPTVQLSLRAGLDPAEHLAIGRALAPLRDEGVFIVGSGMSYHNMRGFMDPRHARRIRPASTTGSRPPSPPSRGNATRRSPSWSQAPMARQSHPREEHLLPLDGRRRRRRSRPGQAGPSRRGHGRRRLGVPVRVRRGGRPKTAASPTRRCRPVNEDGLIVPAIVSAARTRLYRETRDRPPRPVQASAARRPPTGPARARRTDGARGSRSTCRFAAGASPGSRRRRSSSTRARCSSAPRSGSSPCGSRAWLAAPAIAAGSRAATVAVFGLWVLPFATCSYGGQALYHRVFHAYVGRDTVRLGVALRGTVRRLVHGLGRALAPRRNGRSPAP